MDQASTINMKALSNINRIQVRNETLMLLLNLYESKGKTFYYNELFKKDFDAFVNITIEEDIISFSKLLNLDLTDARIRLCAKRDFVPKNKNEQLLLNIKTIISRIQENHTSFELISNEAFELSKMLAKDFEPIKWGRRLKETDSLYKSKSYVSKREDLDSLIELLNTTIRKKNYELTNVLTNFYVDFINMEIFDNHNDLVALIFLYTMLFKNFEIFSYVSFFKYFNKNKERWNLALSQAKYNWDSSYPQTDMLSEILFDIMIKSYDEVNRKAYEYEFEKDLNKSDSIENTILKFDKLFTKEEIRINHPTVSDSTINRTLARLRNENKIIPIGTGRSAKWQVIAKNKSNFQQLSFFKENL